MYIASNFIDLGLDEGEEWTTPFHKEIASLCLLCNPRVFTRERLMKNVKIINSLDKPFLMTATVSDLLEKGCDFI